MRMGMNLLDEILYEGGNALHDYVFLLVIAVCESSAVYVCSVASSLLKSKTALPCDLCIARYYLDYMKA